MVITTQAAYRIRELITAQGLIQKWVADQMGIEQTSFNHILAGRRTIPEGFQAKICQVLGVPISHIFGEEA